MAENQTQPKEGYIIDYISGTQVKALPEELEATQVFSKILVVLQLIKTKKIIIIK